MLARLFSFLCGKSPRLRRALWRAWYNFLGGRFRQDNWTFMNYGYAPLDDDEPVPELAEAQERDRTCIQLYDHLARAVPLAGKRVVEVGSGRGGGCAWVHRRHAPRATRGVDFSGEAVALCRRRHRLPGLSFVRGDAEHLPLPDARVDAVLNVESSHCYGSRQRFYAEAARVLRPGGHFLYADFFSAEQLRDARRWLADAGFETLVERNITPNVLRAMDHDHDWKRAEIRRMLPGFIAGAFEQFAGLKDSEIYESFRTGQLAYTSWVLRKSGGG
ncbi:MAG: hypothetical protein PWP23_769 [Candidatus Sumerlaeota bacterium]|nr:hypothetical protein [Candidatus Sumerlaeota bacterium]